MCIRDRYIPGGDSVFALVVLAVYGLGGIFIPLLTIRWMGYKPDSTHSIAMMVAAFAGVIGWLLLGFGGADGIFPSVPGMGAAFATHFILNQVRTPEVSSLGRFNWPDQKKLGAIAAAILIPFCAFEVSYLMGAPDSSDSMGGVDDYMILGVLSGEELGEGSEYVMDGDTLSLEFNTDSIDSWDNGNNVVAVRVYLSYSEDETSDGLGCELPGASQPEPDTITGTVVHNEYNGTGSGQNQAEGSSSHEIVVEWYNSSLWNAGIISNLTEAEIHEQLDAGTSGFGIHSVDITVDVGTGGGAGCPHTDDGEEVEYYVEVLVLDYSIEPAP